MTTETLNLLPPRRRGLLRLQRRFQVWALAAAGYGMLAVGACFTLAAGEPSVDRRDAKELVTITQEIDSFKELDARIKKEIRQETIAKQGSDVVADHPNWSILLDLLADQRGEGVVVENVEVTPMVPAASQSPDQAQPKGAASEKPTAYVVRLVGFARTQTDVTDFADRLQRTGAFDLVSLVQTSARGAEKIQIVEFLIQCQIGELPPAPKQEPKP